MNSNTKEKFTFKSLTFKVTKSRRKETHTILQNVSGTFKRGDVVCVMGPSGSGKSTLLNALSLRANYGNLSGELKLDGHDLNNAVFKEKCFFVGQHDSNWSHLTVTETCRFAFQLFGRFDTRKEEDLFVSRILDEVGLTSVKYTMNSKLSGGQQRRLSLAIALLKKPEVLFLDEVTSGLDSAAADSICRTLQRIAKDENVIIFCTIHQPSSDIFLNYFDDLILLSKGQVAYAGGTQESQAYFTELGFPVPPLTNPCEFYLELINSDFNESSDVEKILEAWQKESDIMACIEEETFVEDYAEGVIDLGCDMLNISRNANVSSHFLAESDAEAVFDENQGSHDTDLVEETLSNDIVDLGHGSNANICLEIRILTKRHLLLAMRNPVLYVGRCIAALILNSMFGIVYWNARSYTQDQVLSRVWLVGWFMTIPAMMGAIAVQVLSDEIKMIRNEEQNGMLHTATYVLAKFVLIIPYMVIYASCALALPGWVIQTNPWKHFLLSSSFWSLIMYLFESLAELFAALVDSPIIGMILYIAVWIISFLFGGLFVPEEDLYWPMKAFYHATPFSYYSRGQFYILYKDATFEPCFSTSQVQSAICVESGSGSDVLDALNQVFSLFQNKNTVKMDTLVMIGMIVIVKLCYVTIIIFKGGDILCLSRDGRTKRKEAY